MSRVDDDETTGQVWIRLLAAFERSDVAYRRVGESTARRLATVKGRPVVLVVEDDERLLRSYRDALGEECIVLEARDAVEAEAHLTRTSRLDLVILDLVLPIGSGVEVAQALRHKWPAVPVLVVSGYIDPIVTKRLQVLGGPFEFHPKPETNIVAAAKRHLTP